MIGRPWVDPALRPALQFGLKVPRPDYDVAARLNQIAGAGKNVLAPENISAWIPTFRGHAYPLVARAEYTEGLIAVFANRVDAADLGQRLALSSYLSGSSKDNALAERLLQRWLEQKQLFAVAVPDAFGRMSEINRILHGAGWAKSEYLGYAIYSP
jgi:hypothetical protein